MKQAPIVQFNCFSTQVAHNSFVQHWDHYTETEALQGVLLLKQSAETKCRFHYISKQQWEPTSLERKPPRHFQEAIIKMIPAGGYILLDSQQKRKDAGSGVRLFAFMSPDEVNIAAFVSSSLYNKLNVYQAYYESCKFSYVLDFNVPELQAVELLQLLQDSRGVEAGIFKECLVPVS